MKRLAGITGRATIWVLAGLAVVPLYFIVASALRKGDEYAANPGGIPHSFVFSNLTGLLSSGEFYTWAMNSAILTAASVVLCLGVSIGAAHGLTYFNVPGSRWILRAIATLMIVPLILLIVPLFIEFAGIGLLDTYQGAILIYAGVMLPFSIFLLARFFSAVPKALVEAARIDGANPFRVLRLVIIPLTRPAIVTLGVVNAFFVWNDLLVALVFLQSDAHRPLMVGITTLAGHEIGNTPRVMAAVMLALLPIVLLYLATQRAFARGIYGGGLRGE